MTLRITILTLITCLLMIVVMAIGGLGYHFTKESIDNLRDQYLQAVSEGVAKGMDALIQPAFPLLSSIEIPEGLGTEIGTQEKRLIHDLLSQVRSMPELTYLNYGDQSSGQYVAIRRETSGQLVFNRSHPLVDSGHEFEWTVGVNDELIELPQPKTPPYDPRVRDWYTLAALNSFTWTKPYKFFSGGGQGISASLAVKNTDGSLRGVISLAISLDHLTQYLKSIRKNSDVDIFVLLEDGTTVASSSSEEKEESEMALRESLNNLKQGVEFATPGASLIQYSQKGKPFSVTFYPFKRSGLLNLSIAVVIPESSYMGVVQKNTYTTFFVGLLALVISLAAGFFVADRIATPLRRISADLGDVAQFKLNNTEQPSSFIKEIAIVADSVARMKAGLRSFSRFVPHEIVRKILASGYDITLDGEMRQLSLHFSDLANFSVISERLSPGEVVKNLAEYMEILTEILHQHEGAVSQYTGDGLFAFFNAPLPDSQHAIHAVSSALAIRDRLDEVNISRAAEGTFLFNNRIGLHTAEVVVGNIGTKSKLAYSAIGDGVNLASRLEGLNKIYGTTIIASEALQKLTGNHFFWRLLDKVAVVGRKEPTIIYEPICLNQDITEKRRNECELYQSALNNYFGKNFQLAKEQFAGLNDKASQEMRVRCEYLLSTPPPENWNGTFIASTK